MKKPIYLLFKLLICLTVVKMCIAVLTNHKTILIKNWSVSATKTNYNLNRLYSLCTINTKQCNLKVLDKLTLPTILKKTNYLGNYQLPIRLYSTSRQSSFVLILDYGIWI
jgi:hypothetical protein